MIDHIKLLKGLVEENVCNPGKRDMYGLFVNGVRVALYNGKYVWARKRDASNALALKVHRKFRDIIGEKGGVRYEDRETLYKEAMEQLKNSGVIEIKKV